MTRYHAIRWVVITASSRKLRFVEKKRSTRMLRAEGERTKLTRDHPLIDAYGKFAET